MNNVSFGSSEAARSSSAPQGVSGKRGHHSHSVSSSSQDSAQSAGAADSPLARILAGFNSAVANLRTQLQSLSGSSGPAYARTQSSPVAGVSATGIGAQLISKQRGELQIQTQEGDVVTLKFNNKVGVSLAASQTSDGSTTSINASVDIRSRSRISVEVKGDLNDSELAAVNDLVGKVGDLTNTFFNGNTDAALAQAISLNYDSSQLASYSLDLSLKQSLSAYAYQVQLPAAPAPVAVDSSAADPAAVPVPVLETTASNSAADATVAPVADSASAVTVPATQLAAEPTAAAAPPTANTHSLTLAEFVAKVRAAFTVQDGDSRLGFSYELKAKLLVASIEASAPPASKPSAPALAQLTDQLTTQAA